MWPVISVTSISNSRSTKLVHRGPKELIRAKKQVALTPMKALQRGCNQRSLKQPPSGSSANLVALQPTKWLFSQSTGFSATLVALQPTKWLFSQSTGFSATLVALQPTNRLFSQPCGSSANQAALQPTRGFSANTKLFSQPQGSSANPRLPSQPRCPSLAPMMGPSKPLETTKPCVSPLIRQLLQTRSQYLV